MILIILGVIILAVATFFIKKDPKLYRFSGVLQTIGIAVIILGVLTACIMQVDAGEVGVKK